MIKKLKKDNMQFWKFSRLLTLKRQICFRLTITRGFVNSTNDAAQLGVCIAFLFVDN